MKKVLSALTTVGCMVVSRTALALGPLNSLSSSDRKARMPFRTTHLKCCKI